MGNANTKPWHFDSGTADDYLQTIRSAAPVVILSSTGAESLRASLHEAVQQDVNVPPQNKG